MPMAEPRFSGGKTWKMICIASGCSIPAEAPCRMRPAISRPSFGARPETAEPTRNSATEPA